MKNKTTAQLKKELDKVFSIYIRNKYAKNGMVACYTCGVIKEVSKIQNGHFISRMYLTTRFDENNCRPQCVGCNLFGGGKPLDFEERLKKEIGAKKVEAIKMKRHEITKDFPYLEKIEYYKGLNGENNGI